MADIINGKFKATQMFDEIVYVFRLNMPLKTTRTLMHTFHNSFTGKAAVDFLLLEVPILVPGKDLDRANIGKLLQMMLEWKIIVDPLAKKKAKIIFDEGKFYVFQVTVSDIQAPKPRSRRSASFSGARKSLRVSTSQENVRLKQPEEKIKFETVGRTPQKMTRRLSRSNGNIDKLVEPSSNQASANSENPHEQTGHENPGFEEHCPGDEVIVRKRERKEDPGIVEGIYAKKERNYDWLPFFKSKRYMEKQKGEAHQNARRSVSLDRNHLELQSQGSPFLKVALSPVRLKTRDDCVIMHPQGSSPISNISRSKLYESIARRQSPMSARDTLVWKTELIKRFTMILGHAPPKDWCTKIDAHDIQWNASPSNTDSIDGVVRSKAQGPQPDYPHSVIQFMEYLGKYPFSKKTELMQSQKDAKIFGTLVNRLEDLNSPLLTEEAQILVDLLKKQELFAEMLESRSIRRFSRNSIEEAAGLMTDGFSNALPVCGVRASMHRRRTISPLEFQAVQESFAVQEEKFYKIRESWLIEAFQLVLLTMQTSRRRKLHKFILFMRSLATNEVLNIAEPLNGWMNNREAIILGLWKGVANITDKKAGILLCAVLLANHRIIFFVPDDYAENVRSSVSRGSEPTSMYAKVTRGRKLTRNTDKYFEAKPAIVDPQKEEKKPSLLNRLLKR